MAEEIKPIGAAVIGCGGMGRHHGWHYKKNPNFEFIGGFDIRQCQQDALEKDLEAKAFESREALLSDPRVELVLVATPNDVHREIVVDALNHGKNVICEKPVTIASTEDLEAMIAAANANGKFFTVHQNRRWDGDYLTAKNVFDKSLLGRTFHIESRVHGSRGVPGDWRAQKPYGGGMLLDWGIHLLDQMLDMMGSRKLKSLFSQLTYVSTSPDEVDDGFRVLCNFEGDITWLVEVTTNNFIPLPRWYILGENGTALDDRWNRRGDTSKLVMVEDWENRDAVPVVLGVGLSKTMAPRTDDSIKEFPLPVVEGKWDDYYDNIYAVLRNGAAPIVTHDQQRRLIRLVEAIFASGASGEAVAFEQ
ncbi:MAG: Gfo/Idh/MocA family oxidoreductase [Oscillospiraceae bacterium]|jgi:predicted dehydrogenase|nr:Gfo/Idh/MocA family oxidoreductase [Oscillospiraceae bacterium]